MGIESLYKSADFKTEKHVPLIEISGEVKKAQDITFSVTVGKEIPHPNTTAHHISWIELYFLAQNNSNPIQLGRFEFSSHGASTEGADTSSVYSGSTVSGVFKTEFSGQLIAASYCNIHGLWQSSIEIKL
jgi:superoxide reductase